MNFKVENDEIERRILNAFPVEIREDVINVIKLIPSGKDRSFALSSDDIEKVHVLNSTLSIPYRIYFKRPDIYYFPPPISEIPTIDESNKTAYSIFNCIYSRDDNGYFRQACLERLIPLSDPWIPPFVLKLLSEYVIEIIEVIAASVEKLNFELYEMFIRNNPFFITKMKKRIISYWACYFIHQYKTFTDFPGFIAGESLGIWTRQEVRRVRGY